MKVAVSLPRGGIVASNASGVGLGAAGEAVSVGAGGSVGALVGFSATASVWDSSASSAPVAVASARVSAISTGAPIREASASPPPASPSTSSPASSQPRPRRRGR